MESEWNDDSVIELIHFYEANPLLWDPSCQEYRDREKKRLKETEIAGKLQRTGTLYCGKIVGVLLYAESAVVAENGHNRQYGAITPGSS